MWASDRPSARYDPRVRDSVVISGIGLVTPLGRSAWETFRALLKGRRTSDRLAEVDPDSDATTVARATAGCSGAAFTHTDPALLLAEAAARQALDDASRRSTDPPHERVRTILASSKGAVFQIASQRPGLAAYSSPAAISPHGWLACELRNRLGLGDIDTPVAACATSLVAVHQARHELLAGRADRVLVVAVESALHPIFVRSYERLGVLAPLAPIALHECRPLDRGRRGFTLCECSAAIMLERKQDPRPRDVWARVTDSAVGSEPFDLIRGSERLETLERMTKRLAGGGPIALLQPHATGTPENDERELAALGRAFGGRSPASVYASKGAIGHGMGAAGLVNVALSCLIGRCGQRPPMPWIDRPVAEDWPIGPDESRGQTGVSRGVPDGRHLIVCSGFGGHVAGVVLETG